MKAMNFYTANGLAGSNYDSKLSTKEIAAKVRSYAKKNFPEFKFSVRSEWSMYTDSMAVELKSGPCVPFVKGSRSAERGYLSTMSNVKAWKDELTPEVFASLNAVSNYASSFRYDDSDGMQDYFDTNFYIHIEVSDEYKVIEPKAKKSSVKAEKVKEVKEVEAVTAEGLEIVDYSEKAIAVFGDTKAIKDQLKELGGRFNPALKYNGEKRAGWIFGKKQADKVKELIAPTELPALLEIETSKDNIIEWKEIPGCGYEGIELEYIGEGKEYGCIGRCDNGTYWGAFGGVQGSTSGLAPVRKVFDNETDLLNWMKSNGFVYEKKCTLRDFVIKYGFEELKGKKILSEGKIVYIHEKWFAPDKVNDFKDYKKQPYKFRLYGGNTPNADLVNWIYSSDLVIFSEEPQGNDTPLIIDDYAKYDSFDYPTIPEELGGFRLGEVVYDQCGEIGVILAFNEKNGTARVNSNGCCDVGKLKKCPKEIAEREVKHMDIIRPEKALTACTVETYPLENIHLIETDNFNGVRYYDIEGAGNITSAKVRADIQPGDVFNVYTAEERKYGVTYDGVSLESSLKNDLPGIIEYNGKIESGTLSVSSYYTPMDENVEFYEKKVKGKRYITGNKPKRGYYYVIDTLDNCPVGFFQTKGEAEKETEILNGFTDGNGRLKTVI